MNEYALLPPHARVAKMRGLLGITWGKGALCRTMMSALDGFAPASPAAAALPQPGIHTPDYDNFEDVDPTGFVFPCYVLPGDAPKLTRPGASLTWPDGDAQRWIVKPTMESGGSGIFIADTLAELPLRPPPKAPTEWVVQPLLDPPFLINGYKFDMRVYALVTSLTPLRLYIYDQGLIRFAAEPYAVNATGGGRRTQFLTNTSGNTSLKKMIDLLWSFERFRAYLSAEGHNAAALFSRIHSAIARVFLTTEAAHHFPVDGGPTPDNSRSYMVFGVDVILDKDLVPRVIEIDGNPGMDRDTAGGTWYVAMKLRRALRATS